MTFPYSQIADYQNWRKAVSSLDPAAVDPQVGGRFTFDRTTKIASAGSCFARYIAERLRRYGFAYYDAEPPPPWLPAERRGEFGYGTYAARFGEIYTTLQLLQLLERAVGTFEPAERSWPGPKGVLDPFRPTIQPDGFESLEELEMARRVHLDAVRRMFSEIDVFVFTLGLTETWCGTADGAAYPVCPGRGLGSFDPAKYEFRNLGVAENVEYLARFFDILRDLNPRVRTILSVSPVPLAATMEDRHVVTATTYSKSVLRVVADELRRRRPDVDYFASYEIVTAVEPNGYESDRRNVAEPAVDHVMRSFFKNFSDVEVDFAAIASSEESAATLASQPCDEEELLGYINRDFGEAS